MSKSQKKTKYTFPVKHFEDNLLFGIDGSCWAVYEVICEEYDMRSEYGKQEFIARLARFIANIGKEAKIHIVPVRQDLTGSWRYERNQLDRGYADKRDDSTYAYAEAYVDGAKKILEEAVVNGGGTNDYKVYVSTRIENPNKAEGLQRFLDNPVGELEEHMGIARNPIKAKDARAYQLAAERYQKMQSAHFGLIKVNSDVLQWLIGRIFLRGTVQEPFIRKNKHGEWVPQTEEFYLHGDKYKRPNAYNIMHLYNHRWRQEGRSLCFEDEESNITYQTFLALAHMPEDVNIPGDEWLKPLLDLPFGVEICISLKTNQFLDAQKKLKENKRKIEGQDEHAIQSGEVSEDDIERAYIDSVNLEEDLKLYSDPLIEATVTVALANKDKEELKTQVTRVKQEMERMQFRMQRPASDTLKAFYEMIPGSPIQYVSYKHKTSPSVLATSVFPIAIESGDEIGHFLGTAGARDKYIYLSPVEAIRHDRSGGIGILGTLGGGKSVLANYLGYMVTLLDGGRSLFIDPKSERGVLWKGFLKEFEGEIGITTIDYTNKGVFDPFVIYRAESPEWFDRHREDFSKIPGGAISTYDDYVQERRSRAVDLANAMFTEELHLVEGTERALAFKEAVSAAAARYKTPSMELVIRLLAGNVPEQNRIFKDNDLVHRQAMLLAREMEQLKKTNRLASLIIGNGTEQGLSFNKRINIMQINGLTIPNPDTPKDEYSVPQRTSATIMIPLGEFAREFARDPLTLDIPKAVVFDESWFLKATSWGSLLYSEIARMGRSLFTIPIFIGHSVSDVDEPGIREALTYMFVFRMSSELEAVEALRILGLEETGANVSLVQNLGNGQCLFKDINQRVQQINIELLYNNLKKAFETNPERRKALFDELRRNGVS